MTDTKDREIITTRLLNAPRELVFKVWTEPEHIINWWGPNGFTNTIYKMEVKVGGVWSYMMHGPDGTDYPNEIVYEEIVKPERLVYQHGSGIKDDPHSFHVTVTFEQQGDKTLLTMRSVFQTAEHRNMVIEKFGALEGANQTINKLAEYLVEFVKEA